MNTPIPFRDELRRKAVHLSSLWMPVAICFVPRWLMFGIFAFLAAGNLLVEHAYANKVPFVVRIYDVFFGGMLRQEPQPGQWIISGGPYVLMSAAMNTLLFPTPIAAAGMAAMLLGDTAAALIGRRFGRHKTVNGKSFEGFFAFIAAAALGMAFFLHLCGAPLLMLAGTIPAAVAGALAELFEKQLHIDDNFSIPLAAGAVLLIFCFL